MNLSDLSLKRPVFATVIILALVALGIYSYVNLGINDMPEIDMPYVTVSIVWPGAAPAQMETEIARKVEEAVGQVPGVKHITTQSQEGITFVIAEFTMETPPAEATQGVRDKMSALRGELPNGIHDPVISKLDINAMPIVSLAVSGDIPLREMTALVDDTIKPGLEKINGVGKIDTYGYEKREIQINLDKDKLAAYGITTTEVLNSLSAQNLDIPGGKLSGAGHEVTFRTAGKISSVEQFENLPVAKRGGVQFFVKDIAEVEDGIAERESLARFQGRPAIGIDLTKQSGANTVSVAEDIKQGLAELKSQLPPGVTIDIVRDNSVWIRESVDNVVHTIIEGSILAILVVFLFLKDWRSTAISSLALPTSIISTFFAFKLMGYTLNIITLMALSLAVGLLIDDAIVVIENIVRHTQRGKSSINAARDGTAEISLAVLATTLTIVAVFLPMTLIGGILGRIFKPFGLTVVFAVLVSLLVAFTLVPLLSARSLKEGERIPGGLAGKFLAWFNGSFVWLSGVYGRLLTVVLRRRFIALVVVTAFLLGSFTLVPKLGSTFLPNQDTGEINITANLDNGLTLEAATDINEKLLAVLGKHPEFVSTYSTIKTAQINIFAKTVDRKDRSLSTPEIAALLREEFKALPGVEVIVSSGSAMGDGQKEVTFNLLGPDDDQLQDYAEKALAIMSGIPGAVDVGSSFKPGKPEVQVRMKQDVASDLGISTAQVGAVLNTMFTGTVVGQYEEGEARYDVRVRLGEGQRQSVADLDHIYLQSPYSTGGPIPLSQVTEKVFATSTAGITRYDKSKVIELSANLEGISAGDFNNLFLKQADQELKLPEGYRLMASGTSEMMDESFSSLGLAMLLGILFMFFVLAAQFESFIDPLAIILSLPLAAIGAILGLYIGGSQLSIISLIGIILLMGLVTKNAILLIDFAKNERRRGAERDKALIDAARVRFRPIMMTSLAMILSMIPLALGLGSGAELRSPMAHAIIGGLITSTLLTLVIVPVLYSLLDDIKAKFRIPGRLSAQKPSGTGSSI